MNKTKPIFQVAGRLALLGLALVAGRSAVAADNFSATFDNFNEQTQRFGSATLNGIFGDIGSVDASFGIINFDMSLRGTAALLSGGGFSGNFVGTAIGNGPTVRPLGALPFSGAITIPSSGVTSPTFSDNSWAGVVEQIRQYLLQPDQARFLAREAARTAPFDPIAGNPSSMMARMVAYDYGSAFFPFASNLADGNETKVAQAGSGLPAGAVRGPLPSLPGIGVQYGQMSDNGEKERSLSVPLSMTWRSDLDPRRQVSVYLPLTVTDVNGARTTQGTLGASLRLPLATDWALSGNVSYGMLKGTDLGTAGKIGSISLTSSYVFRTDSGDLAIGNMIGRYETLSGTVSGIDTGSEIANTVFRNGLLWSMKAPEWMGGFGNSVEFNVVNTHYTGTELYLDNYTEIGITVGTNRRADSLRSYMQGGVSFLASSKTKGVTAHFGYWF